MFFSLLMITKAFAQEDGGTVAAIEPTTEGPTTINPRINGFCWSCGIRNNVTVSFNLGLGGLSGVRTPESLIDLSGFWATRLC